MTSHSGTDLHSRTLFKICLTFMIVPVKLRIVYLSKKKIAIVYDSFLIQFFWFRIVYLGDSILIEVTLLMIRLISSLSLSLFYFCFFDR